MVRLEGILPSNLCEYCKVMSMETVSKRPPLFSNRALVALTIPVILDALLSIIMGAVDSVMVSTAGESAVSAVSLVDAINIVFISFYAALSTGGSVVTSQYIGSREIDKAKICIRQILYAGLIVSVFFSVLLISLNEQTLTLVYGNLDQDVFDQAKTYFWITALGFPFSVIGTISTATLRAMARNKESVTISMTMNLVNIAGNAILIYGFNMGVAGAAIATTFGRFVFAVMGLISVHRKSLPVRYEKLWRFDFHWDIMKRVLRMGLSNGTENALFNIGRVLVSSLVSSFGTVYIAAHSVANTIGNIGWTITGSFGTVLLTVVGQCIGADETEQAKQYSKKLLSASTVVMLVIFSLVFLLRNQLVRLFDFAPETLQVCAYYVGAASVLTVLACYSLAFTPVMGFRAAGDIRYAMTLSISTMFIFRVGLSYLLCKVFGMGLMGVWLGMAVDWACRSILNSIHFHSGKWLHKKVI